ncbi:MAG: efflux RND transporter permease subunit [Deltaproteobacteria bacterium]|nr:efflux RND transporter permease subunit [Deltaproteobacteria bacterium]
MKLVQSAIRRYRLTTLGILLLLVMGILSYLLIPRREDPLISAPGATILVHYPGAGPRDIERHVSIPLEDKINEIEAVDKIISTSSQGNALIIIRFEADSDIDKDIQELREKVREAEAELPEEALDPEIIRWKTETVSLIVNLSGPSDYTELYRQAKFIRRDLEKIPQVKSVYIEGEQERQVRVEIDEERLSQYGFSLEDVIGALKSENVNLPGGSMDIGSRRFLVRTEKEFSGVREIGETVVGAYRGRPVLLRDLAVVKDTLERPEFMVRFNGRKGINILVTQKPRANMLQASREIRKHLHILSRSLPPGLKVQVFADQALSVSHRIKDFRNNLLMGAGLVILLTVFLMNARMAFIVAFLLPLSIAFALINLFLEGHTLNQITLAAMVIVLGMLVDNGIVVVENIQRHLSLGKGRREAAIDGSGEVLGAITSSTLTTVLAFAPLLFMTGETGQFIRGLPLTMIFALFGSLLVAVFVSPLMSHRFLKANGAPEEGGGSSLILKGYQAVLRWALSHKVIVSLLALAAFLASLYFIPKLGLQFFPKAEKDLFVIEAELPVGTNFDTTLNLARDIDKILLSKKEIKEVMTHIGGVGPRIYYNINFFRTKTPNRAQFFVTINREIPGITAAGVIRELRKELDRLPGVRIDLKELEQGPPVGAPVAVKIKGDNLEILKTLAAEYKSRLSTIPGAVDVRDDAARSVPQLKVTVDSEKARLLGITNAVIARSLRTAIYGTTATSFRQEDEEVEVVVSLGEFSRNDPGLFDKIHLKSLFGPKIPFRQVADVRFVDDIGSITREDRTRTVTVRSEVQGTLPETIVKELKARTASIKIPPGYLVSYEGETKERTESFVSLGWSMVAAFLLVYIVLVAQFNSYRQPFIIAFSLPFGLVGAVLGLWITGYPFGFMAFLGVVSLTGIVVNDAIVLMDFINVLRKEKNTREAILEAGKLRFRPVMLTTISTVGGLLPLALRGGSLWGPMGNVIIFGLSMATLLTLLLIPVAYEALEGKGRRPTTSF